MSRTTLKIPFTDYEKSNEGIRQILYSRGFKERFSTDGVYWQKGVGFFSSPKMIRFDFGENEITVSAWISNFGVESDLNGVFGMVPKKELLEIIQIIKITVK